ncbi:MAG: tRNA epoxyqueuosine(34) reductase QueG [Bacteroidales bacterium]
MESLSKYELSAWIKEKALSIGFQACGISEACCLAEDRNRLDQWLRQGFQGEMSYMERNCGKRADPSLLLPGARSVISVLMNYYPGNNLSENDHYKIARYAYGKDYHLVIRDKLHSLMKEMKEKTGNFKARVFTDSAPVFDRAWAERAGLGWIGKNTCLIHPKLGSYVFIGEMITDKELAYDTTRVNDLCGGCTRCIDACPTGAIIAPGELDARKCISYLTIEMRGEIDPQFHGKFGNWIFGCDICQEACPWNRKALPHNEAAFEPPEELRKMDKSKWDNLSEARFDDLFRDSAVQRTGFEGVRKNIAFFRRNEKK